MVEGLGFQILMKPYLDIGSFWPQVAGKWENRA
jgi:hypothetical protein